MYTENEMRILNSISNELFGMTFEELDDNDRDYVYCKAEEDGDLLGDAYKDFN